MRPFYDCFAERRFPLQCFVSRIELRVFRQRLELSVIAFAPLDISAQLFITDTFNVLVADIFAPEFKTRLI